MEITIWLFSYFGPMLNQHTGKGVSTKISREAEGCGLDSVHRAMSSHPGGTPQPTSPHHKGDEEIGTWPGLSESSGPKYPASHGM